MGLNFQTCTIINTNQDPDSGNGVVLFENQTTKVDGVEKEIVKIKRDFTFVKDNIKAVRKTAGKQAKLCKATVDFNSIIEDIKPAEGTNYCRLDIYVEYEGAEPFYGANPTQIRKGIPFWVEFSVNKNATAKTVADAVAKVIKKDQLFLIDKNIVTVTANEGVLTLEGTGEYLRFKTLEIKLFGLDTEYPETVASLEDGVGITVVERGSNSFGTYSQIVKDLRLPTAANYQWTHIRQSETPIVGATYDQFIIEYQDNAVNHGYQAVGERLMSNTLHVFWVKNDLSDDFELLFDDVEDVDAWLAGLTEEPAESETTNDDGNNPL